MAPAARNVQIHGYVAHVEVLAGAALVIGHGGQSTTMKSLAHVPTRAALREPESLNPRR